MTATRNTQPARAHLFRSLRSAEATAAGYAELVALIENSARIKAGGTNAVAGIFAAELNRIRDLAEEMDSDADDCRDRLLESGYTAEDYEAWLQAAR